MRLYSLNGLYQNKMDFNKMDFHSTKIKIQQVVVFLYRYLLAIISDTFFRLKNTLKKAFDDDKFCLF